MSKGLSATCLSSTLRSWPASIAFALCLLGCSTTTHKFGAGEGGGDATSTTTASGTGGQGGGPECTDASSCDDDDACTDDACNGGKCEHTPVVVDDNDACTDDACDPASGVTHTAVAIDDNDVCTDDSCDSAVGPIHMPIAIDDMDACTDDLCDPQAGESHPPVDIDDLDACTADSCDVLLGVAHDAIDPDDANACTADSCDPAVGVQNTAIDPDDQDLCTADSCDVVMGVINMPIDLNDNDGCTVDTCDAMTGIAHTPVDINDNNACTSDACNPADGVISHVPVAITDNNACTSDACDMVTGVISHTPIPPVADANPCTLEICNPATGATDHPGSVTLFSDDFKDNSKGWILGTEWAIGPALGSTGGSIGGDPATDHTATADNGVAGVVIGGNAGTGLHGFYYLESPPFNAVIGNGSIVVSFYRWLVSDYDPFMHNTVDVWNGNAWVNLYTSGIYPSVDDTPPSGGGWTLVSYDATAQANPAMKIRFGFDITQSGVYSAPSWSLDDVLVENRAWPTDGNLCTTDTCSSAAGVVYTTIVPNDGDSCTTDTCDPQRSFSYANVGSYKLNENFSSGAGWTVGTEWAIGPAAASTGNTYGNPDPAFDTDHTTNDNRVAGVVLGGNASLTTHSAYYLTSPAFSGTPSTGQKAYLSFNRWLNSDYSPYMVNTIDVYNGSSWVNIWTTGGAPGVQDTGWVFIQHDVTAYANANMQVRFGFTSSTNALTVSQWNLDDVRVRSCP